MYSRSTAWTAVARLWSLRGRRGVSCDLVVIARFIRKIQSLAEFSLPSPIQRCTISFLFSNVSCYYVVVSLFCDHALLVRDKSGHVREAVSHHQVMPLWPGAGGDWCAPDVGPWTTLFPAVQPSDRWHPEKHGILYHGYVDCITAIALLLSQESFHPFDGIAGIEVCLCELSRWMVLNQLRYNPEKTNFILSCQTCRQLVNELRPTLHIVGSSSCVRSLICLFVCFGR